MATRQNYEFNVDLVLCIDATGSMFHIIDKVKDAASNFHDMLIKELEVADKEVTNFRVKVIVFRDYYWDDDMAMKESQFFNLPSETAAFRDFVSEIKADGGHDEPESALEAIALAMNSDWVKEGTKKRHIIMIWTDASAHPLETEHAPEGRPRPAHYPKNMPSNFMELSDWWNIRQSGKMNPSAKRLIIYAPDKEPWSKIRKWEQVVRVDSVEEGKGMDEMDMEAIMLTLVGSV